MVAQVIWLDMGDGHDSHQTNWRAAPHCSTVATLPYLLRGQASQDIQSTARGMERMRSDWGDYVIVFGFYFWGFIITLLFIFMIINLLDSMRWGRA